MKRIIILLSVFISAFSAFSQTFLQEGDRCFDAGDYACAITNYKSAMDVSSGQDKQKAEIKLSRANRCAENLKAANQAFTGKNYTLAKQNYQSVLEGNPKDEYAQTKIAECEKLLTPATTLSVSNENISFIATGGRIMLDVKTNANDYQISYLPSWCHVKYKYPTWFLIECDANNGIDRKDWFKVSTGDKEVKIYVTQTGKTTTKQETTLSVTSESLTFKAKGGTSDKIHIYSNATHYSVSVVPNWCKVQTNNGYIVVICYKNISKTNRQDYFTVNAGDKSKRIYVTQKGKKDCSNNPKTRDIWGLTVGYAHNHHSNKYAKYGYGYYGYDTSHYMPNGSSHGMQIGIRAEPLFKYGFGLNTGVYADFYFNDLWAINIPLHFEYRGNFSKWFSMFAYCGLGANFVADYALNTYLIPINLEYGGGFRINHVQFNIGSELNLWDLSWQNGAFQRKLIVSISYMF